MNLKGKERAGRDLKGGQQNKCDVTAAEGSQEEEGDHQTEGRGVGEDQ